MKTVIVACGSGIATSTIICDSIEDILNKNNINFRIVQCSLQEVASQTEGADLVVTSMKLEEDLGVPTLVGIPFLIGAGQDELERKILEILK